jgi:hypothetical protein
MSLSDEILSVITGAVPKKLYRPKNAQPQEKELPLLYYLSILEF